ncbi:olfactory receptor 1-like [Xyrauchen texanus]|uniref:olfactory receptor 1-like n=1 Tax=Xyrauchen texanus TaxID=154827 RepID=UPI0022420D94|nr:olfactory receptor 1-like [Xyrauchen texanus]
MTYTQSDSTANATFVRPGVFFINGFSNIPHAKYYYVFLFVVYAVTVFGNSFIMCTIYLARRLHTAKYICVFNLALSDLCGSSALIPKLIDTFLFEHQEISYEACLANMFFVFHFMNLQSLTLLALAYDRLIAICFPLRYHVIVNNTTMFFITGVMWIFSVTIITILVCLVNRLSFCQSNVVSSYFCDHGPIFRLACNDYSINNIMTQIFFALLICMPLLLIIISYFCIAVDLLKIAHGGDRMKAMKTCISHLMLVAVFYLPILSVNIAALMKSLHPNARIINNSLSQTIPPMLNPIIYTLKTEEVMQSIKELYNRSKVNSITERNMKFRKKKLNLTPSDHCVNKKKQVVHFVPLNIAVS